MKGREKWLRGWFFFCPYELGRAIQFQYYEELILLKYFQLPY